MIHVGWKPEMLDMMQKAGIPEWYIESCEKIGYLFPRAHDMVFCRNYEDGGIYRVEVA